MNNKQLKIGDAVKYKHGNEQGKIIKIEANNMSLGEPSDIYIYTIKINPDAIGCGAGELKLVRSMMEGE